MRELFKMFSASSSRIFLLWEHTTTSYKIRKKIILIFLVLLENPVCLHYKKKKNSAMPFIRSDGQNFVNDHR